MAAAEAGWCALRLQRAPVRVQAATASLAAFLLCAAPWLMMAAAAPQLFAAFPNADLLCRLLCSPKHYMIVLCVAAIFEPLTWLIHRYVMHGPLWWVHEDHHLDTAYQRPQLYKNDFFPLVFAVPSSTLACLATTGLVHDDFASCVFGSLLYGVAYLYVHEELFHRRFGWPGSSRLRSLPYMKRLATAHGAHHSRRDQAITDGAAGGGMSRGGGLAFGFLYAPPRFEPCRVRWTRKEAANESLLGYYLPLIGWLAPCDRDHEGAAPAVGKTS